INETQPARVVSITADALGGVEGRRVSVLGAAFKAGTDDLRESPGMRIVELLLQQGAEVTIYDPLVSAGALKAWEQRGVTIAPDLQAAIEDADACVIATRADEFRSLKDVLRTKKNGRAAVIDGRRLLDPSSFEDYETYSAVGRSKQKSPSSLST
ncbi:MAG: UDP binding domain-containing protein, partial [Actinomycetota bacterium]